ncbi:hypothetical protein QBC47DRAFT_434530 [Echria macrotheca]|uniref:RING-type domain-containing protein n=1 Tax=Echria macrotheca TaxID=438768 RepID=A0AAJ0B760_9PEZI|nr:hypothetical protein QBC47DRAFT_434530 [Echria macrotheca]
MSNPTSPAEYDDEHNDMHPDAECQKIPTDVFIHQVKALASGPLSNGEDVVSVMEMLIEHFHLMYLTKPKPRQEESCFHRIRAHVTQPLTTPAPIPTCPVCYAEISCKWIEPSPGADAEALVNGSYFRCTHMVCNNCLKTIITNAQKSGADIHCPVCRANTAARVCGHHILYRIPRGDGPETRMRITTLPLTAPEDEDGKMVDYCHYKQCMKITDQLRAMGAR